MLWSSNCYFSSKIFLFCCVHLFQIFLRICQLPALAGLLLLLWWLRPRRRIAPPRQVLIWSRMPRRPAWASSPGVRRPRTLPLVWFMSATARPPQLPSPPHQLPQQLQLLLRQLLLLLLLVSLCYSNEFQR